MQAEDNLDIESSSCWSPHSKITWAFSRSLHGRRYNLNPVSNICKTAPVDLRSGPPTDSTNYHKYILNSCSVLFRLANWQWLFEQANHGAHSNPGTQVGTQNSGWSRPSDKGGGGHPVPEIKGVLKQNFPALQASAGARSRGGGGRAPPLDQPLQNKVFGTVLWTD